MTAKKKRRPTNRRPQQRSQSAPKEPKTGRNWFLRGLGLSGIAALSATAGALLALSLSATPYQKTDPSQANDVFDGDSMTSVNLQLPKLTRPVNILILGTKVLTSDVGRYTDGFDARVNSFDGLSDTMLLVRFDPDRKAVTVLSMPRDTRVELAKHGAIKINSTNQRGGAVLAAKAVTKLLDGVTIDRYVRVNVQGAEKLIDALGGVEIYVPKDMKYTDQTQHLYIDLKKGWQRLNGEQAVQFMLFRQDALGDIGRVQRQQLLMRALVEQAASLQTVRRVPKILDVIESHLDTNLSVEEMLALSAFAAQTDRDKVQMLMLPGEFSPNDRESISYWLPDDEEIDAILARHFDIGDETAIAAQSDPAEIRIAIQDSTDNPDAVRALEQQLRRAGYRRIYTSTPWYQPLAVTRILAQKGDDTAAASLQQLLGVGELRVESTGAIQSDVTILLGRDWWQQQRDYNRDRDSLPTDLGALPN